MVLRKITQTKKVEEPEEEYEEVEEPDNSNLDEQEQQIKQKLSRLNRLPEIKKKIITASLKVVNRDQIPVKRMETVQSETGELFEVITIEEALTEILSILRESA
jgi:hypothetical protein